VNIEVLKNLQFISCEVIQTQFIDCEIGNTILTGTNERSISNLLNVLGVFCLILKHFQPKYLLPKYIYFFNIQKLIYLYIMYLLVR
jgi:hypothetical protein